MACSKCQLQLGKNSPGGDIIIHSWRGKLDTLCAIPVMHISTFMQCDWPDRLIYVYMMCIASDLVSVVVRELYYDSCVLPQACE